MNFKKIINSIRFQDLFPVAFILSAMVFLAACNTNNSDEKVGTQKAPDTEVSASEPAKTKKGKASVASRSKTSEKMTKDKEGIYLNAEVTPAYPGGDGALSNYISDNISYDPAAIESNEQGTVMVSFVVDEKGDISIAKVDEKSNVNPLLEQEAIRVVSQMPKWEPGVVKGKKVKTWMHLPITFRIEE